MEQVVKASSGHYPQPFLISICKELVQRKNAIAVFPNNFLIVTNGCSISNSFSALLLKQFEFIFSFSSRKKVPQKK
jgi:hypothetical protein